MSSRNQAMRSGKDGCPSHDGARTKLIPISCSIAHHSPALFDSLKKSGSPDLSSIGRGGGGEGGYPMSLGTSFREEMS